MKRILFYGLMICLLSLSACGPKAEAVAGESAVNPPAAEDEPAPTAQPTGWFVPALNVNCRLGPSTQYPILAVLTPGAQYIVFGINEDASWLFINTSLTQCWVKRSTGESSEGVEMLPLMAYGPVPAGGGGVAQPGGGEGGSTADSGGSGGSGPIVVDPGLVLPPLDFHPIVFCGLYTDQSTCVSNGCTWVPFMLEPCGPTIYCPVPAHCE